MANKLKAGMLVRLVRPCKSSFVRVTYPEMCRHGELLKVVAVTRRDVTVASIVTDIACGTWMSTRFQLVIPENV